MEMNLRGGLLIVGNRGGTNVGESFERAALGHAIQTSVCESSRAMAAPVFQRLVFWHLFGHRPPNLEAFGREVVASCRARRPSYVLATGIAPLTRSALHEIGAQGALRLNYLTDDPWNPAHYASWFIDALPSYDTVFTTRTANQDELRRLGCRDVRYLPFAYDPTLFFPEALTEAEKDRYASDVFFAGGADADRVPYVRALRQAGFKLALYGSLWDRFRETRGVSLGQADARTLRLAIGGCRVALGLVRRANRDGHSMRTYEVPAVGACLLLEDTREHRELFGPDGTAAAYFKTPEEMTARARALLADEAVRRRMSEAAHRLIADGGNTYADRLRTMLAGPKNASSESSI